MKRNRRTMTSIKNMLNSNRSLWLILLVIFLIFFSVKSISIATTTIFSFDGSQTAQVARNLARSFQYATDYEQKKLFDPKITTGSPVIFPMAIFFKIFGESFSTGLIISAIYTILLAISCSYYLTDCLRLSPFFSILMLLFLLGVPKLNEYGYGLYGEIPMVFYFLLCVIFISKYEDNQHKKFIFLAGIFLGLGYLTKATILICLPALFFSFLFRKIVKSEIRKKPQGLLHGLRVASWVFVGFIVPLLIFESFRIFSIGLRYYPQNLKERINFVLNHPGFKFINQDSIRMVGKISHHMDVLESYLITNKNLIGAIITLLFLLFLSIVIIGLLRKINKKNNSKFLQLYNSSFIFLITTTLSYFGWWLIITDLPWERYIFPGVIILGLTFVNILKILIETMEDLLKNSNFKSSFFKILIIVMIGLFIIYSGYLIISTGNYRISFRDSSQKIGYLNTGKYIHSLPNKAQIFGYGWWEAPVMAFASGRTFDNLLTNSDIYDPGLLEEKYFVYDHYAYFLDPDGDKNILDQFDFKAKYTDSENYLFIYKLNSRPLFAYQDFSEKEKSEVNYSQIDFTKNDLKIYTRNVYVNENNLNGKFAQRTSAYLLRYDGESHLKLSLWFQDINYYSRSPIKLDIYINRTKKGNFILDKGGTHEFSVPLEKLATDWIEVTIICNAQYIYEGADRVLSFSISEMRLFE